MGLHQRKNCLAVALAGRPPLVELFSLGNQMNQSPFASR